MKDKIIKGTDVCKGYNKEASVMTALWYGKGEGFHLNKRGRKYPVASGRVQSRRGKKKTGDGQQSGHGQCVRSVD